LEFSLADIGFAKPVILTTKRERMYPNSGFD
jgi:hypothetical protein